MKKTLLLSLLCLLTGSLYLSAQTCMRDSSIYGTDTLLAPPTWTPQVPNYNLALACVEHPYNQSVTFNVPPTFMNLPVVSASVAQMGAISNLPVGVTYSCDPPNCTFPSNTLGCILLYGTPTAANSAPDTLDLGIKVKVNFQFGAFDLEFPINDEHYYVILQTAACPVSGTNDISGHIASVRNVPNPFSGMTQIEVGSYLAGDFRFEVFDMLGQRVYSDQIRLEEGLNKFSFDAGYLANGSYIYTISNAEGKVSRLMAIAR